MAEQLALNWIDVLLVAVLLLGMAGGFWRGFVLGLCELVALAGALVVALWGFRWPAALLEWTGLSSVWAMPAAFLLTFLFTRLILGLLLARVAALLPPRGHAHALNRVLGLVPGAVSGAINAAIAAILLVSLPLPGPVGTQARASTLAQALAEPAQWLEASLAPIFEEAASRSLDRLLVKPGSRTTVALPYRLPQAPARSDLETRMLALVNEERARQNLRPLVADPELAEVARAHSRDMFARGYFSHNTPDGKDPFDRMRAGGVRYLTAGENIALAPTLPLAHRGLMNSPGHRANILRPAFGRVGIGIVDGGVRGVMVTQNFRN
jgi:uncharacterized protein YkwD